MAKAAKVRTQSIDPRLTTIEESQSQRSPIYRWLEAAAYLAGAVGAGLGLIMIVFRSNGLSNGVGVLGVGFTLVGVGVALSIYRTQADQTTRESARTSLILDEISSHARSAAETSAEARDIVVALSRSREAASAETEPAVDFPSPTRDGGSESGESEDADDAPSKADSGVVRVEGDGEYRYPPAVPLYVLADLVKWWPEPRYSYQRWTVGNLVGAYRRFNASGKLTGSPWIVTFRRSNGELANYRLSYAGRKQGPSISVYSAERNRWQDFGTHEE